MILLLKILAWALVSYAVLYLVIPPGNFIHEGLRLPFWIFRLRILAKTGQPVQKINYGTHFRQYLLHHKPPENASTKKHVVIYIHGSGWQFSRPEMFAANAQWLTSKGYHAFLLSHRRIPRCDIRELREDTCLAIKAVLETMEAAGLSDKKILLAGNSSGGNLCALAMFDRSVLAAAGLSNDIFAALALFATPLDLNVMWPSPPLLMVTRMKDPNVFQLANPIHHLSTEMTVPILLIHGDKDGIAEYRNSVVFYEKLKALGAKNIRFETLKGGMHLDSASWCFPEHESSWIFLEWLESIE